MLVPDHVAESWLSTSVCLPALVIAPVQGAIPCQCLSCYRSHYTEGQTGLGSRLLKVTRC